MNINLQQAKSLLKNNKVIAYIKQNGMPVYTDINEFVPFNNAVFKSICIDLLHDNNIQLTYDDNITYGELATINNNDLLDNVILSDDWVGVTSLKDLKFFTGFTTIKNLSNDNDIFANIEEIDMRNISTIGSYAFLNHTGISLYNYKDALGTYIVHKSETCFLSVSSAVGGVVARIIIVRKLLHLLHA